MTPPKRIGILTSGSDCAGLNAAIRAVVHRAIDTYTWEVIGIFRATQGLMERSIDAVKLTIPLVDRLLRQELLADYRLRSSQNRMR